jgi:hypothetical protein
MKAPAPANGGGGGAIDVMSMMQVGPRAFV